MKERVDICIIDFFPEEYITKNRKQCIMFEKEIREESKVPQGHGIALIEIMKAIVPELKYIFVPVVPQTTFKQINEILFFLIKEDICSIINMSFGFYYYKESDVFALSRICMQAKAKNILLVCADDENGKIVYPAADRNVICVRNNDKMEETDIYWKGNIVYLRTISLKVRWTYDRTLWVYGNSYYAAIVSGLLIRKKNNRKWEEFSIKKLTGRIEIKEGRWKDKNI